jgi:hypothetical protein
MSIGQPSGRHWWFPKVPTEQELMTRFYSLVQRNLACECRIRPTFAACLSVFLLFACGQSSDGATPRDGEIQRMNELVRRESEIVECIPKAKLDQVFSSPTPRQPRQIVRNSAFGNIGRLRPPRAGCGLCEPCGTEISVARLCADPMVQCLWIYDP